MSKFRLVAASALVAVAAACAGPTVAPSTTSLQPQTSAPTTTRDPLVTEGEALVTSAGCVACHSTDGTDRGTGDTFLFLFGAERTLTDGRVVIADADYLRLSIVEADADIVPGWEDQPMASYPDLSERQLAAIIAFIESLGS